MALASHALPNSTILAAAVFLYSHPSLYFSRDEVNKALNLRSDFRVNSVIPNKNHIRDVRKKRSIAFFKALAKLKHMTIGDVKNLMGERYQKRLLNIKNDSTLPKNIVEAFEKSISIPLPSKFSNRVDQSSNVPHEPQGGKEENKEKFIENNKDEELVDRKKDTYISLSKLGLKVNSIVTLEIEPNSKAFDQAQIDRDLKGLVQSLSSKTCIVHCVWYVVEFANIKRVTPSGALVINCTEGTKMTTALAGDVQDIDKKSLYSILNVARRVGFANSFMDGVASTFGFFDSFMDIQNGSKRTLLHTVQWCKQKKEDFENHLKSLQQSIMQESCTETKLRAKEKIEVYKSELVRIGKLSLVGIK